VCGIAGKFFFDPPARLEQAHIEAMLRPIHHRGPDGGGVYVDGPVGLGHRRLSIIDLSSAGAQPMSNEDDTVWIVFNGEIYNYQELREQLLAKGHQFKSHTDTEVIIHLYEEYGVDCLQKLRGMFAFALWDKNRQRLFAARDRVGIKPLYYHVGSTAFSFGSELKSILVDPSVPRDLDLIAVRKFLSFYYIPGEDTLLKSVRKLLPGHYLLADRNGVSTRQYWDLVFTDTRWSTPYDQAVDELRELLRARVGDHMMADVPVGVLLSGGMDSTAVCSLAVHQTEKKLHTFTIGFDDPAVVDERKYARLAAQQFGTEHHELTFTAEDFWNALPLYVSHMEEPVCEPPAIALYYITKLAREYVKVVLSGEGGDEAFAGYPNYPRMLQVERLRHNLGPFAAPASGAASLVGRVLNDNRYRNYGHALTSPLHEAYYSRTAGPTTPFNSEANSLFSRDFLEATASFDPSEVIARLLSNVKKQPLLNQLLYIDTKTWLPDDLLVKADKMTMANSVELRVPLLDHTILEFAASLPPDFKVKEKETKRILKTAFAASIPEEVLKRKKAGFPVPYERWLAQDPRTKELLDDKRSPVAGLILNAQADKPRLRGGKELFSLICLNEWISQFYRS
jgi:asparagine synthase (glutamine-hydrolysing)